MENSQPENRLCTSETETPHSTSVCPLIGLLANLDNMLPDANEPVDDAVIAVHNDLYARCLRYRDSVDISHLDS